MLPRIRAVEPDLAACWRILPKVSRSFAIPIGLLPAGIRDTVMIAYLLCRVVDTVEDSALPPERKSELLEAFPHFLRSTVEVDCAQFGAAPPYLRTEEERELMALLSIILGVYHRLHRTEKEPVVRWISEMCTGMSRWLDRPVVSLEDLEEYCHYVAGTVGCMLSGILLVHRVLDPPTHATILPLANSFGVGLQKVNVIRDVHRDLEEGRRLWPRALLEEHGLTHESLTHQQHRPAAIGVLDLLVDNAQDNLLDGLTYLTHVPKRNREVRLFCAIPLFMAKATLALCRDNPNVLCEAAVKMTRRETEDLLHQVHQAVDSNELLHQIFHR